MPNAATFKLPTSHCPHCQTKLDGATALQNSVPNPGDVSICIECGEVNVFDEAMKLRVPTKQEQQEFPWAMIRRAQGLIQQTRRK